MKLKFLVIINLLVLNLKKQLVKPIEFCYFLCSFLCGRKFGADEVFQVFHLINMRKQYVGYLKLRTPKVRDKVVKASKNYFSDYIMRKYFKNNHSINKLNWKTKKNTLSMVNTNTIHFGFL